MTTKKIHCCSFGGKFNFLSAAAASIKMEKSKDNDVVITKEVFHVSPQYIDLTTDGNETDITHIHETQIPQNLT